MCVRWVRLAQERVEDMKGFSLLHDYVITDKYYVFTQVGLAQTAALVLLLRPV